MSIVAPEGIDRPGDKLTVAAKGILSTTFEGSVNKIDSFDDKQIVVEVSVLLSGDQDPTHAGLATLTLDLDSGTDASLSAAGTGSILFTKAVKVRPPLRLLGKYDLTACHGAI